MRSYIPTTVKGRVKYLEDHIFDYKTATSYEKVEQLFTEAINYIETQIKSGGSKVKYTIEGEEYDDFQDLEDPDNNTVKRKEIIMYDHKLKQFVK